jgi:hypothetical protein
VEAYGKLPLSFEINQGQADSKVKFLSRGSGYSLFLTGNEAVLALRKGDSNSKGQRAKMSFNARHSTLPRRSCNVSPVSNFQFPISKRLPRTTYQEPRTPSSG